MKLFLSINGYVSIIRNVTRICIGPDAVVYYKGSSAYAGIIFTDPGVTIKASEGSHA